MNDRQKKRDFTQYVHKFELDNGEIRYAVAEWYPGKGQYIRPFDDTEAKLTGCSAEFARKPCGVQYYASRKKALRRARYLYYEMDKEMHDLDDLFDEATP